MTDLDRRRIAPEVYTIRGELDAECARDLHRSLRRNASAWLLAATALPLIGGMALVLLARLFLR